MNDSLRNVTQRANLQRKGTWDINVVNSILLFVYFYWLWLGWCPTKMPPFFFCSWWLFCVRTPPAGESSSQSGWECLSPLSSVLIPLCKLYRLQAIIKDLRENLRGKKETSDPLKLVINKTWYDHKNNTKI